MRPNPFVQPLIHFVPCSVTYSAALVLKRQCDRTPGGRRQKQNDLSSCPGCPGHLSGLSVSHSKSVLYGTFVWARRVLNNQKRRFPARAVASDGVFRPGQCANRRLWPVRKPAPHRAFGFIGTALSKQIRVFQSSSLKVVAISPNASYKTLPTPCGAA